MAQLKDTIVTGDLSVTGTIYGDVPLNDLSDADDLKAIEALTGTSGILTKTAANTWSLSDGAAPASHTHGNITNAGAIGTTANKGVYTTTDGVLTAGTIPVAAGGTGATTFTSGALLIGNGTSAVGTRTIKNMTAKGDLGWTAAATDTYIPTVNTLAYWNGRYNSSSSNLQYCNKGEFGNAVTYGVDDATANGALGTGTGLTTERSVYYGLVTVNNASQTRATGIYAPTSAGTAGYILKSSGGTAAPVWLQTLPVANGGTGATTAAAARTNLLAATGNGRVFYGTCATAAGTAEKAVTCASYDALTTGDIIIVKFSNTNSAAVADLKLNVNSKGAKAIKKLYNYALSNLNNVGELRSNVINMFVYDGTNWILSNADYNTNTNTLLRTWSSATDISVPLIGQSSANSITAAWTTYTGDYKDWYGAIPNDDTKRAKINLSTGRLTVGSSSMGTDTAIVRNISYGTTEPTGGNAGQVYIQYASGGKPEIFPIGAIYMSVSATNPSEFFAGTWEQVAQGRTIFGAGSCAGISYTSGTTVDAGLPNISGSVVRAYSDYNKNNSAYSSYVSDPFYYTESETYGTSWEVASGSGDGIRNISMDLSRANSIYGNSTTVQPNAFVCYIWQRTA